jgi:dipeptide/tripeptide permease
MDKDIQDVLNQLDVLKNNPVSENLISGSQAAMGQSPLPVGWDANTATFLGIAILIFGLIVFFVMAFLICKGHKPDAVMKICALPLVIISAIFLVVIGYSSTQIAPVMALLSAIAGYLLGNRTDNIREQPPE